MPVSSASRYAGQPVYDAPDAAGATHPTVAIRPPAPPPPGTALLRHTVSGLESLEYLAWRYLGSSEAWWRVAEANDLAFPLDLSPGQVVQIGAASDVGRVVRTRRF